MNASQGEKPISKAARPATIPETLPPGEPDDLGRIRDILFGQQVRAYDARLKALETRTQSENAELRSDMSKRLASLEDYVKGELNALSERVRAEQDERYRAIRQVTKELREDVEAIDKRMTAGAAQVEEELRLLREQVLHYSQSVRDEIRAATEETSASLPH